MSRDFTELQGNLDSLFKNVDDAYNRAAKAQGVSSSTFDILYSLYVYGNGLTQKQICEYSYSNKQTINTAIHKLEKEGVLQLSAGHGRATCITLTDTGAALCERIMFPCIEAERRALEAIPANELERFMELANLYAGTLVENLNAIGAAGVDETDANPDLHSPLGPRKDA